MASDGREKMSQTMRIDLIPDSPSMPLSGRKTRYVVAPSSDHDLPPRAKPEQSGSPSEYQELLQSLYDAALITDMAGTIIDANLRAVEYLLYEKSELLNLTVFDIVSGADESLIQMLQDNLKNERFTLIQAYCMRKDSSLFPSEIAVNKLNLGAPCLCFFVRDITLRRQAEEMLRTEHNAIQNSGEGIAIGNIHGLLEYVNPAVVRMWGFKETSELLGLDFRDLLADRTKADHILNEVMGARQFWSGEVKARRSNGTEFDMQASAACNRNSDGEQVGMILSFTDISDRKRADEAEREAERRRVMLESFGAACHHLGQPATVLLANLDIMKQHLEKTDDKTFLELLENSIAALETLGGIMHKLNTVNEYRTTKYLDSSAGEDEAATRIIEI